MKGKKYVSINLKLAFLVCIILIGIIGVSLIANKLFFYDYYLNNEKKVIYEFAETLDLNYGTSSYNADFLEEFLLKKRANVMIFNVNNLNDPEVSIQSDSENMQRGKMMLQRGLGISQAVLDETLEKGHYFFNVSHGNFKTQLLGLSYKLRNGDILLITLPYEALTDTANLAIKFNAIIAFLSLFIGVIAAYFISRSITKPIIKLSQMTEKITKLDFTEKYESVAKDEINVLGENINKMSTTIEKSLIDLKNSNEQLILDIKEKDKLVEMRKDFISNISHELKTPLALIMSYTEGLKNNIVDDEVKKNYYLDVITKESNHMDNLVKDLLNLTELEYDAFKLNVSTMDMSSLVDEILDRYTILISNKRLNINIRKDDIILVKADKNRLEQAISNLIVNALEHTEKHGYINLSMLASDGEVKLVIENSGSNIPEENIDKIWTNFYKLKNKTDRKIGGSGIGLSIVRAVIEKHKGRYGVINTVNGVEFWISIPK